MSREYVEQRGDSYFLVGSRVTLDSVIHEFLEGASPETIGDDFPTLSLEQVYGAITFYLANRAELDAYLAQTEAIWEAARKNQPLLPADLKGRVARTRRELASKRL